MRFLENKKIKSIIFAIVALVFIPIFNYIINALCGLGKIFGTLIRFLATI